MTEWNASEYAQRASLQEAMAEEVLALLHLSGDERLLDVGCGDGRTTARIADRLPRGDIVGVDASRQMIDFASTRFAPGSGAEARPNLRFEVADARALPFDQQFDLAVSFNALHWIPEQSLALRSIRKALKPGGAGQLRLVPGGERKSLENVLEDTRLSPHWQQYFRDFRDPYLHLSSEEYAAVAEESGFRVLGTHTSFKAWDFHSREAFFAFGSVTFVEWTRRLPEDRRPSFIHDVLDRYESIACEKRGEENFFRFYQMDITLARDESRT
jgi:trans-aconitate 2-methyltransferase